VAISCPPRTEILRTISIPNCPQQAPTTTSRDREGGDNPRINTRRAASPNANNPHQTSPDREGADNPRINTPPPPSLRAPYRILRRHALENGTRELSLRRSRRRLRQSPTVHTEIAVHFLRRSTSRTTWQSPVLPPTPTTPQPQQPPTTTSPDREGADNPRIKTSPPPPLRAPHRILRRHALENGTGELSLRRSRRRLRQSPTHPLCSRPKSPAPQSKYLTPPFARRH